MSTNPPDELLHDNSPDLPAAGPPGTATARPELGREALSSAARSLSAAAGERWVQIADRVIAAAMRTPRRSLPIRARADSGPVYISEHALITLISDTVGQALHRCALEQVHLQVDRADTLSGVTLFMVAQYGHPLLGAADLARDLTLQVLHDTLGPVTAQLTVATLWVHFDNVTIGDPTKEDH